MTRHHLQLSASFMRYARCPVCGRERGVERGRFVEHVGVYLPGQLPQPCAGSGQKASQSIGLRGTRE